MSEFGKSQRYDDNYYVSHNGKTLYFHKNELGQLYRELDHACRKDTGYGSASFYNGRSEVNRDSSGVSLESQQSNGWVKTDMTYGEARQVLKAIEDRVAIEEALGRRS
jgi:hypothetical protein